MRARSSAVALAEFDGAREIVTLGADILKIRQRLLVKSAQVDELLLRTVRALLELEVPRRDVLCALERVAPFAALIFDRALDGGRLLMELRELAAKRERGIGERVDRASTSAAATATSAAAAIDTHDIDPRRRSARRPDRRADRGAEVGGRARRDRSSAWTAGPSP